MPTVPLGNDVVVIVSWGDAIVIVRAFVIGLLELSVTCAVKFAVPVAVGVPVIAPALLSDRPVGREPLLTVQTLLPAPPLAARV